MGERKIGQTPGFPPAARTLNPEEVIKRVGKLKCDIVGKDPMEIFVRIHGGDNIWMSVPQGGTLEWRAYDKERAIIEKIWHKVREKRCFRE